MSIFESDVHNKLNILRLHGDLDKAEHILKEWANMSDKFADKWHALASLFVFALNEGRLDKALEFASDLLKLDESDAYAHGCLGQVFRLSGNMQQAEQECQRALDLARDDQDPGLLTYIIDLAEVFLCEDNLDNSEDLLLSASDMANKESDSALVFVRLYRLLGRLYRRKNEYQTSIEYYRRAMRTIQELQNPVPCCELLLEEMIGAIYDAEQE